MTTKEMNTLINPILNIVLEDDDTPYGGVEFAGETVSDFCESEDELMGCITPSKLNKILPAFGIKPITANYKCGGCVRCQKRRENEQMHCTMQSYEHVIKENDEACIWYWDKAAKERIGKEKEERERAERQLIWKSNAAKPPVSFDIISEKYGKTPVCPTCGETPYDKIQCRFCGQRFLPCEEVNDYFSPEPEPEETILCVACGQRTMKGRRSKYNGHFHGKCTNCGAFMME